MDQLAAKCIDNVPFLIDLSGWFLLVSFWVALAYVALDVISKVIAWFRKPPSAAEAAVSRDMLATIKGLIEALAAAPAWFALFLAGCLLLWISSNVAREGCAGAFAGLGSEPGAPADGGDGAAAGQTGEGTSATAPESGG